MYNELKAEIEFEKEKLQKDVNRYLEIKFYRIAKLKEKALFSRSKQFDELLKTPKINKRCNTLPSHLDYLKIGRCRNLSLTVKIAHFYHKKIEIRLTDWE